MHMVIHSFQCTRAIQLDLIQLVGAPLWRHQDGKKNERRNLWRKPTHVHINSHPTWYIAVSTQPTEPRPGSDSRAPITGLKQKNKTPNPLRKRGSEGVPGRQQHPTPLSLCQHFVCRLLPDLSHPLSSSAVLLLRELLWPYRSIR